MCRTGYLGNTVSVVGGAHRHDIVLLEEALARIVIDQPAAPYSWLYLGLGYVGRNVYERIWQIVLVPWVRSRRNKHKSKREGARVRHSLMESSHGWLYRYRRLLASRKKG